MKGLYVDATINKVDRNKRKISKILTIDFVNLFSWCSILLNIGVEQISANTKIIVSKAPR